MNPKVQVLASVQARQLSSTEARDGLATLESHNVTGQAADCFNLQECCQYTSPQQEHGMTQHSTADWRNRFA